LDAYITRFERTCQAFEIPRVQWTPQLARLLKGSALEVYERMLDHEINDYELLKERLLKRFQLTEGGYRKKFKRSHMEKGETPEQFVERLRRFMRKWREMAGGDESYEGLEIMVSRDQFFTARHYASAVLAVIVCLSVCPSVCLSVCHKSELYKDS